MLAAVAAFLPLSVYGIEEGIQKAKPGIILVGLGLLAWFSTFFVNYGSLATPFGISGIGKMAAALLMFAGGALGLVSLLGSENPVARFNLKLLAIVAGGLLAAMLLLKADFGLEYVETSQWGGLLVTLVVAITGIVASLPLGILLALGRQSKMPIVKIFQRYLH